MRQTKASFFIFMFDAIAFALAFVVSNYVASAISSDILGRPYVEFLSSMFFNRVYVFAALSAAVLFSFYNKGHYRSRIPWWNQVRYILIALIMVLFIDGFSHFAMKYQFSRLWIMLSWSLSFVFLLFGRILSRIICEKLQIWKVPTVVIGSGDNVIDTMFAVHSDNYTGYDIKTLILHGVYDDLRRVDLPIAYSNINIIDGSRDYSDYIKSHHNSFYIIAPDSSADIDIEKLLEILSDNGCEYAKIPPIKGISLFGTAPQYFFGHDVMLLQARRKINSPFGRIFKRFVDLFCSGLLIIILSPLFLTLYLLVKKEGGSVFFYNKRLGRDGKEFYCLKFRTMVKDAEKTLHDLLEQNAEAKAMWETHRKLHNDPRITKIGKFLRKSSLDELPQLINILKGEMSLVGPRPILPDEVSFFEKCQLSNYYSVRPGITGLWQVSGRNNTTFKRRVHLDSWYITNWTIWCDVVILFKTITTLVKRAGAY